MSLTGVVQLGNIVCRFDHFGIGIFDNIWTWQADPYRIVPRSGTPVQLIIENAKSVLPASCICLREEYSGFFKRQVFRTAEGGTLWSFVRSRNEEICLQYAVSPAWDKIELLTDHTQTAGHVAFEYLGQIVPYCALNHNILTFHGVLMEYNGQGIIISAPSGTGKTTHARMWRDSRNAIIINGDRATCYIRDGKWIGCGLPWSGTSGEHVNRSVPIKAMVVLERHEKNRAYSINGLDAFGAILPHIQCPAWDRKLTEKAMELADHFLGQIPVIRLKCRPDLEAVEVLNQVLEKL